MLFGLVAGLTGSYRQAILSLVVLFLAGMLVLLFADTDRAIRDARARAAFDGPGMTDA